MNIEAQQVPIEQSACLVLVSLCYTLSSHSVQRSVTLARLLKINRKGNLICMIFQVLTHA